MCWALGPSWPHGCQAGSLGLWDYASRAGQSGSWSDVHFELRTPQRTHGGWAWPRSATRPRIRSRCWDPDARGAPYSRSRRGPRHFAWLWATAEEGARAGTALATSASEGGVPGHLRPVPIPGFSWPGLRTRAHACSWCLENSAGGTKGKEEQKSAHGGLRQKSNGVSTGHKGKPASCSLGDAVCVLGTAPGSLGHALVPTPCPPECLRGRGAHFPPGLRPRPAPPAPVRSEHKRVLRAFCAAAPAPGSQESSRGCSFYPRDLRPSVLSHLEAE